MTPLIRRLEALGLPGGVVLLLLAASSLVFFKLVRVKMLPFDNKSELQVIVDMPEGTTLGGKRPGSHASWPTALRPTPTSPTSSSTSAPRRPTTSTG